MAFCWFSSLLEIFHRFSDFAVVHQIVKLLNISENVVNLKFRNTFFVYVDMFKGSTNLAKFHVICFVFYMSAICRKRVKITKYNRKVHSFVSSLITAKGVRFI